MSSFETLPKTVVQLAIRWWMPSGGHHQMTRAHGRFIFGTLLLLLLFSTPWTGVARGESGGWQLQTASKIRHNPIGLGLQPELSWRLPLSHSDHPLLRGTGVETGFLAKISPASFHPGLYVEAVPLSLLVFRAQLQQLRYFGFFGHLTEYEGRTPDWSPATREGDQATGRHATGWTAATSVTLRLKVGRFLVQGRAARQWYRMQVSLDHAWYDSTSDLIYAPRDHLDRLETTAGAFLSGGPGESRYLFLGGRWRADRTDRTALDRHLLCTAFSWRPGWWAHRELTFAGLVGRYLTDPYRAGQLYVGAQMIMTWREDAG